MAKFKFPKNPGTDRENPFEDAGGANPFSDGPLESTDGIKANVFAVPEDSVGRSYTPGDYEKALVPRGKRAFRLAILGLVPAVLGVISASIGIVASGTWISPLFYALPVQFAALAAAVPAFILARRDLRAINAGAMNDSERGKSRLAYWVGACAAGLGAAPVILYFAMWIVAYIAGY